MTDRVKEQLSACLDGELPEAELDLLLKQVSRDRELRASLGRYALIGETLRSRTAVAAPADFSQRIAAAIAAEPPLGDSANAPAVIEPARKPAQWLRPVAGLAVAAGVAAVAILSLQPPAQSPQTPYVADASSVAAGESSAADPASYIVPASTTGYVPAARLTNYVVAHSEYSMPLGRRSVLSGVLTDDDEERDAATDDAAASDAATDDTVGADSQTRDDVTQP